MTPDTVIAVYEESAAAWDRQRPRVLFEAPLLLRLLALAGRGHLLDLGCGTGRPLAVFMRRRGARVTGLDGSAAMLARFRRHVPGAPAVRADLRRFALRRRFRGILAWDSVFHLTAPELLRVPRRLAAHGAPGAAVLVTTGDMAGEVTGCVDGRRVYHASLSLLAQRRAFEAAGLQVIAHRAADPAAGGHTWWLLRRRGLAAPHRPAQG